MNIEIKKIGNSDLDLLLPRELMQRLDLKRRRQELHITELAGSGDFRRFAVRSRSFEKTMEMADQVMDKHYTDTLAVLAK